MDKIEISDVHEDSQCSFGKFQVWYLKASR